MKAACASSSASDSRGGRAIGRCCTAAALLADAYGRAARLDQDQRRLPAADQLDIDLGEQLGVEQRAVLGAPRIVDAVALAQMIEPIRTGRMSSPRQQQRIDQPLATDQHLLAALKLGIEEAEIEIGVVRDQRRIADEFDQLLADLVEEAACP